ncbi:MAG: hypothetical protein ABW221_19050 [Vicinamibacteria bacterium]
MLEPRKDVLAGWSFTTDEVSYGVYEITGVDTLGRTVCRTGSDPDAALAECVQDARELVDRASRPGVLLPFTPLRDRRS